MHIKRFDPKHASETEYRAVYEFGNKMHAEWWPEDPHTPYEQFVRNWQNMAPLWECRVWLVWYGSDVIAKGEAWIGHTGYNEHLMDVGIDVLPAFRRQGIARRLLREVTQAAADLGKTLFIFGTGDVVPAGEALMVRLGADRGMVSHTNQLDMADLDLVLMRQWMQRAEERAQGYELGEWIGAYPEAEIAAIARMYSTTNDAPRDDLQVEDEHRTPEQIRESETAMLNRGSERWTMYVRETATGELAGFTEIFWHPTEPEIAHQGWTAVVPRFRNLGLGRWLKAAMIEKLRAERPQVKRVRTGNADSNGPMLAINHEMGFKPYRAWTVWQIERVKVEAYLNETADDREPTADLVPELALML